MDPRCPLPFVVLAALLAPAGAACAATYHVSPAGADTNAGTPDGCFRSIGRAAEIMQPGDTCVVHAGTYRETVRPARSGSPGRPIRFEAAKGENVLITGADVVTGWSAHAGRIYKAAVTWEVDQLLVAGRMMTLARFPDAGRDPYKPNTIAMTADGTTVTADDARRGDDYWKGGTIWAMSRHNWVAGTAGITASRGAALTLDAKVPFWSKGPGRGYIEGVLAALDRPGEWCQLGEDVFLWPPGGADPQTLAVAGTRRRWAFDLSGRSHVEVAGFGIVAGGVNMDRAEHCLLDRCRLRLASFRRDIRGGFNRDRGMSIDSGGLGIVLGGRSNTVRDSVVAYCVGDGISVYGEDNRVLNCVVHDCNLSASDCAPVDVTGRGHAVVGCTIYNAGRSGLLHRKLRAGRIERNEIYSSGLMTCDLGATYTFTTDGEGTVIAYNRIRDTRCRTGIGIYIDNVSANHVIHHNLCYDNQDSGIRVNTPAKNILVYNNTLARNGNSISYWGSRGNKDMTGVVVLNNIFTDAVRFGADARVEHNFTGADPGFVDAAAGDFRLKEGSPCADAGTAVEGITDGHAGTAPDIGCFERGRPAWSAGSTLAKETWDDTGW